MIYNVNETFQSLKGEGLFTGVPMSFIRLAGCNLNCTFCDTKFATGIRLTKEEIYDRIKEYHTRRVVLTGGEPLYHDGIYELCDYLKDRKYKIHVETNGTFPPPFPFDWVTVSPKNSLLDFEIMEVANEVKYLCGSKGWQEIIFETFLKYKVYKKKHILLMPIAVGKNDEAFTRDEKAMIEDNVIKAMDFCMRFPQFRYCAQIHKYLNIR